MARHPKGTWDGRRGVYVAALGDWYEPGGGRGRRRRVVTLCCPDGTPVRRHDEAGRMEAVARLMRRNAEVDALPYAPTLAELFQLWIDWHRMRGSADTTIAHYVRAANLIRVVEHGGAELGAVPAHAIGDAHLMAVRAALRARGGSEGYIRSINGVFLAAIRWAAKAIEGREPLRILPRNPFPRDSVSGLRAARSDRECPTWEGMQKIMDAVDALVAAMDGRGAGAWQKDHAAVRALHLRVVAERGCRPIEVARLRVEQWAGNGFVLARHKSEWKTGAKGVIHVGAATAARVQSLIDRDDRRGPWVFAPWKAESDGPPADNTLRRWWATIRGRIPGAERLELYSFRNCLSNALRMRGAGEREMQLALRHTKQVADTVYRRDLLDEAAKVFEAAGLG